MAGNPRRLAVFPGSFDPITNGHLDVIRRGARLFDELVVGVGENPDKSALFDKEERVEIVRKAVADIPNVRVESFEGLTADFARGLGAAAILRGVRSSSDLQREFQLAMTHRVVAGVETLLIMTGAEHAFISSSLIRQIVQMGGDVSALVPKQALPHIQARFTTRRDRQS